MNKILVISNSRQRFLDQLSLCIGLRKLSPNILIKIVVDNSIPSELYSKIPFKVQLIVDASKNIIVRSGNNKVSKFVLRVFNKLVQISKYMSIVEVLRIVYYKIYLYALEKECLDVVDEFQPTVIITNGDRHWGIEQSFLKIAKLKKISIIIPYLSYSGEESLINSRRKSKIYTKSIISPVIVQLAFKLFKDQILVKNKGQFLFYTPSKLYSLKKYGTLSSYPWCIGNGLSNIVCVDSAETCRRYLNYKVKREKIAIVGDVAYDNLYKSYCEKNEKKIELVKKYALEGEKKTVVCSLPQLGEHGILPWKEHWKEISFLVKTLESLEQNVLLSLHPKMDLKNYEYLQKDYNCRIVNERLFEILPVADLFVATFSSTVVWAVLCGIKSVVVDFYGLQYAMYDFLKTIVIVSKKEVFIKELTTTINKNIDFREDWKNLSRNEVFDGRTVERYEKLIKKQCERLN